MINPYNDPNQFWWFNTLHMNPADASEMDILDRKLCNISASENGIPAAIEHLWTEVYCKKYCYLFAYYMQLKRIQSKSLLYTLLHLG